MTTIDTIRTNLRELQKISNLPFSQLADYDIPGDQEPLKQAAVRLHEAQLLLSLASRLMHPDENPQYISQIIERLSSYDRMEFPECGKDPQVDAHLARAAWALDRALSAIREVVLRRFGGVQ